MGGGEFERELKGVLEGRGDVIAAVTKSCSEQERTNYFLMERIPFMVIRAAGSFGIDLVAFREGILLPVEVKSSKNDRLWLGSEKHRRQVEGFHDLCRRSGVIPIYAFRLKGRRGDSWRVFTAGEMEPKGLSRLLHDHLPKVTVTDGGNVVLPWNEGMPMNRFAAYLDGLMGGDGK
ncbi:MAG: Holliday junction resolvase [Thermoplasmata archaeon]|nr:Holliday junction resolvase [Thermoplasmata archaeon]